jgi:hypothetical protein
MLRPESSYIPKQTPIIPETSREMDIGFNSLKMSLSNKSLTARKFAKTQMALTERPLTKNSESSKLLNPAMYTRALNPSPFYMNKFTVINEEEELFPDNCLTIFDNSGLNNLKSN